MRVAVKSSLTHSHKDTSCFPNQCLPPTPQEKHSPGWGSGLSLQTCGGTNSMSVCHQWTASLLPSLLHSTLRPSFYKPGRKAAQPKPMWEGPRPQSWHPAGTLKPLIPVLLLSSTPNLERSSSLCLPHPALSPYLSLCSLPFSLNPLQPCS